MTDFDHVNDSGERQEFDTGSVRDTQTGKGRYDLLPPYAMSRLARHFENGAVKYGDRNWEKGQPIARYADSALRHIFAFLAGDMTEDHLAAGVWNLLAAIETERRVRIGELPQALLEGLPRRYGDVDTWMRMSDEPPPPGDVQLRAAAEAFRREQETLLATAAGLEQVANDLDRGP